MMIVQMLYLLYTVLYIWSANGNSNRFEFATEASR